MVLPDPVWIVPGYIPAGMTILAARPKIGKSWLAMQISHAVASGGRIFDQEISQGKVLYLALEDPLRRLQERLILQGWKDQEAESANFLTFEDFRKYVGYLNKGGTQRLRALIEEYKYHLVVIDTLSRAFTGIKDINNSQDVTEALAPLQQITTEINCGILLNDHHNKPKGFNPDPIDDVMASTAKSAIADTIYGIYTENGKRGAVMKARGRDIEEIDKRICFDKLTGAWQVEGDTNEIELAGHKHDVLTFLKVNGKSKVATIVNALGLDRGNTYKVLDSMVDKGLLTYETIEGVKYYDIL
jgi:RecA-family ATPase